MKYDCELIKDIMPIYIDEALSDKSKEIVKEHLNECKECNDIYQKTKDRVVDRNLNLVFQNKTVDYAKKIKKTRMVITVFIGIMIIGMASMGMSIISGKYDTFVVRIGSYIEAKEYIERGWIPQEIPKDAKEISIIYNIDSNNVNGEFYTSKEGVDLLVDKYELATVTDLIKTDTALNNRFKKIKEEIINYPQNIIFLKNESYIFAIRDDSVVFYFAK